MTIGASSCRVHDVAAQTDERAILAFQVQRDPVFLGDAKPLLHAAVALIIVSMDRGDARQRERRGEQAPDPYGGTFHRTPPGWFGYFPCTSSRMPPSDAMRPVASNGR